MSKRKIPDALHPLAPRLATVAEGAGIYFLIKDEQLVYIGQSKRIKGRVPNHRKAKEFDRADFIEVPRELLDAYEGALIRYFRPPLNIVIGAPRGTDASILCELGLDPSTSPTATIPSPPSAPPMPDELDDEDDWEDDEDAYDFYEDVSSEVFPLLLACAELLLEWGEFEHRPCPDFERAAAENKTEAYRCSCPPRRVLGGIIKELAEHCDGDEELVEHYIDKRNRSIHVTWSKNTRSRFEHSELVDALMHYLDADGPWAVVVRREDDPPGKYWTLERWVYNPETYLPPMERVTRASDKQAMAQLLWPSEAPPEEPPPAAPASAAKGG